MKPQKPTKRTEDQNDAFFRHLQELEKKLDDEVAYLIEQSKDAVRGDEIHLSLVTVNAIYTVCEKLKKYRVALARESQDIRRSEMERLHKFSSKHRDEVLSAKKVGCFYCLRTFSPKSIREWTDKGRTAVCPHCGIDSILPKEFDGMLIKMNLYWFQS